MGGINSRLGHYPDVSSRKDNPKAPLSVTPLGPFCMCALESHPQARQVMHRKLKYNAGESFRAGLGAVDWQSRRNW
jgi:hypothetical protein